MPRVLITGGAGFVGGALTQHLTGKKYEVWSPSFDLTLADSYSEIAQKGPWDTAIHLAGWSDTASCKADPIKAFAVNAGITAQLANTLGAQAKPAHFIFSSSGMVYKPISTPITEDSEIAPQNFYAETKHYAEILLKDIALRMGIPTTIVRLFNHTHSTQDPRFFLPFIYQDILKIKEKKMPPVISVGNIKVKRDLGTIQDLLKAFTSLVESPVPSGTRILNLCSGQARSLESLAYELGRQMDVKFEFVVDPAKLRADHDFIVGSCAKFQKETGWKPETLSDSEFIGKFLEKIN
jgi:GDP-4-dehydro-6-deoxy-D-mannose reductase